MSPPPPPPLPPPPPPGAPGRGGPRPPPPPPQPRLPRLSATARGSLRFTSAHSACRIESLSAHSVFATVAKSFRDRAPSVS